MPIEIVAALIAAGATIIAALIGLVGLVYFHRHPHKSENDNRILPSDGVKANQQSSLRSTTDITSKDSHQNVTSQHKNLRVPRQPEEEIPSVGRGYKGPGISKIQPAWRFRTQALQQPAWSFQTLPEDIHGWSANKVRALQQGAAKALDLSLSFQDRLTDGSLGLTMIVIPAGRFLMGSPKNEVGRWENERQHPVTIGEPVAIGRYPVTFEEYDKFCRVTSREKPDDKGWERGRRPVINISWYDAIAYVRWLSEQTGQQYRLPTEAEWEYACRAGTITPFCFGEDITPEEANYNGNYPYLSDQRKGLYREQTVPVGSIKPNAWNLNAWGLYDMHGNVAEWTCSEWDSDYSGAEKHCAKSEDTGSRRVYRGGHWNSNAGSCRSAARYGAYPTLRDVYLGFRVARQ